MSSIITFADFAKVYKQYIQRIPSNPDDAYQLAKIICALAGYYRNYQIQYIQFVLIFELEYQTFCLDIWRQLLKYLREGKSQTRDEAIIEEYEINISKATLKYNFYWEEISDDIQRQLALSNLIP